MLLLLVASAAQAAAQPAPSIQARTPARGGPSGGTTVEVLANVGWFGSFNTTVTMTGPINAAQPTNVVVHSPTRLTFVTPPRLVSGTPYIVTVTSGSTIRTTTFFYVARTRRSMASARKPSFSYDGRYVAFESRFALAANDTNGLVDIYVRNRLNGAVRRVSIASAGGQALGGESTNPSMSATGRFIAFQSRATNLVPGDTNGLTDVFLHDRDADGDGIFDEIGAVATERVNLGLTVGPVALPTQAIGGGSSDPVVSGNGRYIAYQSAATNLLASDPNGHTDVFVFDRQRRITRAMSTNINGVTAGNHSRNPAMSLSGRFVVFESLADDIAGGNPGTQQTGPISDIFLRDRDTDQDGVFDEPGAINTSLVSSNRCEQNLTNHSVDPSITYDGRFVVFATAANNAQVVDGTCTPDDRNRVRDIFIYDRQLGAVTRRLSQDSRLDLPGASGAPVISGNGNLLLFRTQAVNGGGSGASAPNGPITLALSEDGKSTTGQVPSPTTDTPPPADVPPAPPSGSTEDPATSGDGNTTGNTTEPDPGTGGGEPVIEVEETPEDSDGTPSIGALSPSSGPTTGGNVVDVWGANFTAQSVVRWNDINLGAGVQFVNSALLRVTVPAAPGGVDGPVPVRVIVANEATNEVEYSYVGGLITPTITSFALATGPVTGGTTVTISGSGFSVGATVRFGAAAGISPIVNGAGTSIGVTTPPVDAAGPASIVVQNSNGTTAMSSSSFTYEFAPVNAAPVTQPLTPSSGPITGGTAITVSGQNFTPATTVTVGGVPATGLQILSNTQIVAVTPAGAQGPADVVVTTTSGTSTEVFQYEPLAAPVLACNLTSDDDDLDGMADIWELQYGFSPLDATDGALDSDGDGRTNAQECAALTHPRGLFTRYLAEGATGSFFDTRVVVANPGATPARVLFRFQTGLGEIVRHYLVVPATSRRTIDLRLLPGLESANVSTVIESDVQVVVDRTMRWDQQSRAGAHAESSSPAPSLTWYLAEGATHGSFALFYLIQNPSPTQAASVRIRYLLPAGAPIEQMIVVNPNTRATIAVDEQPGLGATDVSAVVESLNAVPIIVERAMYSSATGVFAAGHDSAGVTSPSLDWFFAEGATGSFFDTFLLMANPNALPANVTVTYLLPSGAPVTRPYVLQPNSRTTINVQEQHAQLNATAVSMRLTSTNGVTFLAERSMWWPHGQAWFEAHNAAGATTTGTKWAVGDGEVGLLPEDTATFLLVANTAGVAATVRVTLLFETGASVSQDFSVPANSRFNVPVVTSDAQPSATYMRVPRGTRFSAIVESLGATPIVVERAMYWNANGQLWAAGSDLLATKLQ
ncbi:MAG: IPT/TIG domain-containing protein [Vicinamibacteraceae bacterium]